MTGDETRLYFAYGSNLHAPRMRERVPSASVAAVARLDGFALVFTKRGADGSAKCDIVPVEGQSAWGVVYRVAGAEQPRLDAAEGSGYGEIGVTVAGATRAHAVFTYRARPGWQAASPPQPWYRDLVLAGAREHGLPTEHITRIEAAARAAGMPLDTS